MRTAGIIAISFFLAVSALPLSAQLPSRGVSRSAPKNSSADAQNKRRRAEEKRRRDAARPQTPTAPPAAGGARRMSAEERGARRVLDTALSALRLGRRESARGEVSVIDRSLRRSTSSLRYANRRSKEGSTAVVIAFDRIDDLPPAAWLGRLPAKGSSPQWWRYAPEEASDAAPIGDRTPRLSSTGVWAEDLLPFTINEKSLAFLGMGKSDGRDVMRFKAEVRGRSIEFAMRSDVKLVSEIVWFDGEGKRVSRKLSFGGLKYVGVHRRWTSWLIQDLESGTTTTVKWNEVEVNRAEDSKWFEPGKFKIYLDSRP